METETPNYYLMPHEQLLNELISRGAWAHVCYKKFAEAKVNYEQIENKAKPILATLKVNIRAKPLPVGTIVPAGATVYSPKIPNNEKEDAAYSSEEWQQFQEGLTEANRNFQQAKVEYEMAILKVDILRTVISFRKSEIEKGL